ncbi:MAG: hypothetical protein ACYCVB_07280, partial [Bacilli bacterium]
RSTKKTRHKFLIPLRFPTAFHEISLFTSLMPRGYRNRTSTADPNSLHRNGNNTADLKSPYACGMWYDLETPLSCII